MAPQNFPKLCRKRRTNRVTQKQHWQRNWEKIDESGDFLAAQTNEEPIEQNDSPTNPTFKKQHESQFFTALHLG